MTGESLCTEMAPNLYQVFIGTHSHTKTVILAEQGEIFNK